MTGISNDRALQRHGINGAVDVYDSLRDVYIGRLVNIHSEGLMIIGDVRLEEDKLYKLDLHLPEHVNGPELQRRLFDEHKVEIPVMEWNGRRLIRVSIQGYNNRSDLERLYDGIAAILGE